MLKLMLVDDEPIIRKGIRTSIDWKKYNIEVAGEASNGRDALEKALELKPQILITDIRMPVMDGLTLVKLLKSELPETEIIILSGYEDFSYAKEALSLGVNEYLLKPVDAEELITLITRIQNKIINTLLEKQKSLSKNIVLNENFLHIKSNFTDRLLKKEFESQLHVYEQLEILKLNLYGSCYLVFVLDIDDFLILTEDMTEKDKELIKFSVQNISEELILSSMSGFVCYSKYDHLIGIVTSKNLNESMITDTCLEIQKCINAYLKLSISIGIGTVYNDIMCLSESYSEALAALKNKIYTGKSSVNHYITTLSRKKSEIIFYPFNVEKDILNFVRTLNYEGISQAIENIFISFKEHSATPENIKNICSRLIVTSISCLEDMGINIQSNIEPNFYPFKEIEKIGVLDDIKDWLLSFFSKMISIIQENKTLKFKSIIKFVLQYIEDNYHTDISLGEIASLAYVTPNYLSRIFKEEMNINFVDWLNNLRVEKAKNLLLDTNLKTYEVANKVGYNDYKYFSYIFKKITGYTPKEFRETRG